MPRKTAGAEAAAEATEETAEILVESRLDRLVHQSYGDTSGIIGIPFGNLFT